MEKDNTNMKKKIEKLRKQLDDEIDSNNKVNKEADDLYEEAMKYKDQCQDLKKKYDELLKSNSKNKSN